MKKGILLFIVLAIATTVSAQDITGTWSGNADLGGQKLTLAFHIEKTDDGYSGTMDSPDQGAVGIPLSSVDFAGDTCRIALNNIGFKYTGVLEDDAIKGSFTQMGMTFTLDLARSEAAEAPNRPQEPIPPYPYISEDVVFVNPEAGIRLAGTLTRPEKGRKFPAVVMITGSGAQNRDEELFGHKPFLVIADHLTRNGIAVLRFDDRGFGSSEGDHATATGADFAGDARAAVEYLKTRPEIDPKKIGLAGHSEGGSIAFAVASQNPRDIAFVVSLAGAAVPGDSITLLQVDKLLTLQGMPRQIVDMQLASQRKLCEILKTRTPEYILENVDGIIDETMPMARMLPQGQRDVLRKGIEAAATPWTAYFFTHDPADDLRGVECPVFAANGSLDVQVGAAENLAAISSALDGGGNAAYVAREYPLLNHLFQYAETGNITEYAAIEETFAPEVLEDMTRWIKKTTKTR